MKTTARRVAGGRLSDAQVHRAEDVCKKMVSRLGTFQQADRDDFVQGALAELIENPSVKDEDVGFCVIGHLMNIIYRYRDDALREDGRLDNERERLRTLGSERTEQERTQQVSDAKRAVEKALSRVRLTSTERLYVLAYLSGEKHIDTARRLGVTRQAVGQSFLRALTKIAKVVEWPE